jgi:hypothetical protein
VIELGLNGLSLPVVATRGDHARSNAAGAKARHPDSIALLHLVVRQLERFRAKSIPVRLKRTRQNENLKLRFRFNQNR